MCGRYTNTATNTGAIRERFDLAEEVPGEGLGRANVSPTQQVLAVVRDRDEEPRPVMLRWGLAPPWATLKGGPSLINARDDKIASSNANAAAREVWASERLSFADVGSDEGAFRATVERER